METHLYGVFYTVIYVLLCRMFIETFEEKRNISKKIYRDGAWICLTVMDYAVSVMLDSNIVLKEIVIMMLGILFMWGIFRQRITKIAILVILYQGICFVIDYIAVIVISKCFSAITIERLNEPLINLMIGILSQMLLICFIMLLRRYGVKKSSEMLTAMEWARFTVFPAFTIVVLIALLTNFEIPKSSSQKNILLCIAFGLLVMNLMVFHLINDILKREALIRENRLLIERAKNETGMYRAISENYEKQRKREHEHKNQMAFIAALARSNKIDEINHYLKEYNEEMIENTDLIDANHVIVNAVLNSKYKEAREKGIVFVVKVNDLSELRIKDEDIVLILSNLLSNAIEASTESNEPVVKLKFTRECHQIIISVVNTLSKEPCIIGNKFITTKEDTENHGIGIENIRESVEKNGGSCVIKYDESSFRFTILIPDQ